MGITGSMSRRGNCYDNAVIESFWHSLKSILVHHRHFTSRAEVTLMIFDYIKSFYNRVRLQSSLGYMSPEDFKATHAAKPHAVA